jgi:thiol:disulfide interchange protein
LAALSVLVALFWATRQFRVLGLWETGIGFGALLIGLVALAGAAAPLLPKAGTIGKIASGTIPFSESRLNQLRTDRRPVLLYFTADWCLTCKVNEKAAIERSEVQLSFKAKNIAVMVGDWTNGDAAIGRFLESHGRSGVPLYLYYPADGSAPRELPQVLTMGMLVGL